MLQREEGERNTGFLTSRQRSDELKPFQDSLSLQIQIPLGLTHPVIPLIWKFPRWDRYSCSVRPGNLDARN
jgi:hypothetical protein